MIVAITGHRFNKMGDNESRKYISFYIKKEMSKLFDQLKPSKIISGLALMTDTIAAELAIENNIPFIAAVPFVGQELMWSKQDQQKYHELLSCAEKIEIISKGSFSNWKYHARNAWMVDNSDALISVYDEKSKGGTKSCIDYAVSKNKKIFNINPLNYNK